MTRDAAISQDLKDLGAQADRWRANIEGFAEEARAQGAIAHANLYDRVVSVLNDARSACETAATLMDPEQTEAEDFA